MLIHNDTRQTAGMAVGHLTSEGCKKETCSKALQPKWEMSCAVHWGDARLEITPTIHNILVYFLCQLRDKQQDDYKGNNKPTVWNAGPIHPAVSFDIKVRFTAELFKSCIEPQRRNKMGIIFILKKLKWQCYFEKPSPESCTIRCLRYSRWTQKNLFYIGKLYKLFFLSELPEIASII